MRQLFPWLIPKNIMISIAFQGYRKARAEYLPLGGRGTAQRWMRVTLPNSTLFRQPDNPKFETIITQ